MCFVASVAPACGVCGIRLGAPQSALRSWTAPCGVTSPRSRSTWR